MGSSSFDVAELLSLTHNFSVLYAEDQPEIRHEMSQLFANLFDRVEYAEDGLEALKKYQHDTFDIVITDILMPNMNGFELARSVRQISPEQHIIVVSAHNDPSYLLEAIRQGFDGYIIKPIEPQQLFFSLNKVAKNITNAKELKRHQNHLEELVWQKTQELYALNLEVSQTLEEIIMTLGNIVETHSKETSTHALRVAEYAKIIAESLGMSEHELNLLYKASPLHDIGKIGIPETILTKPSQLTREEYELVKRHTTMGYEILSNSKRELFLAAATISLEHHEAWDGSGYPRGIKGEDAHIFGRIISLVDVFDALTSTRCYKSTWELPVSYDYIAGQSGLRFDPKIVECFLDNKQSISDKFHSISEQFGLN